MSTVHFETVCNATYCGTPPCLVVELARRDCKIVPARPLAIPTTGFGVFMACVPSPAPRDETAVASYAVGNATAPALSP